VLTPGTYRVVSRSHLINTTFTVEFAFACTVHAHDDVDDDEQPQQPATTAAGRYHAAVIGLALVGSFTLAALLAAGVVALCQRAPARNDATTTNAIMQLATT
jgi:hypothetical protein